MWLVLSLDFRGSRRSRVGDLDWAVEFWLPFNPNFRGSRGGCLIGFEDLNWVGEFLGLKVFALLLIRIVLILLFFGTLKTLLADILLASFFISFNASGFPLVVRT